MLNFKKEALPFKEISISLIDLNPSQPRKSFDENQLAALTHSISRYGMLNPLTVRQNGERYELISGERRLRAAKRLGLALVPCHIVVSDRKKSAEIALVENIVRADLDFFEEAQGLLQLQSSFGLTQNEIADKIGKTQSAVANKIRLLRLDEKTREAIAHYNLTERHARALLRLSDPIEQWAAAKYIGEKGMNVAESEAHIENIIKKISKTNPKATRKLLIKDLRLFVNAVKNHTASLISSGINADFEQAEDEEFLIVSVKIPKKIKERP